MPTQQLSLFFMRLGLFRVFYARGDCKSRWIRYISATEAHATVVITFNNTRQAYLTPLRMKKPFIMLAVSVETRNRRLSICYVLSVLRINFNI